MGRKITFIFWLILILSFGCDKGQLFDSTGTLTTEIREVRPAAKIAMYDNVNVIFTSALDSGTLKVVAGKNIIAKISTEFKDNTLIIRNNNKWNWTRDLDPDICVYVSNVGIESIYHESVGTLSCEHALTGADLDIKVKHGNGKINLELYYDNIVMENTQGGSTDMILSGLCSTLRLYHFNYAPMDCRNLWAQKVVVTETGIQNSFVFAVKQLEAIITNYGNIYYYGDPEIVKYVNTGNGKLIQQK